MRLLQVCLTPPRAGNPCAHPPYPSTSHPYVSSHRVGPRSSPFSALICIRPIMSSDSPSHPRRRTSRPSIKPRLFLLQLTPPFPTSLPGLDAFSAEDCSLVTTPTRTSLTRAHRLCAAPQQPRISLTSGSPSTDDIVPK